MVIKHVVESLFFVVVPQKKHDNTNNYTTRFPLFQTSSSITGIVVEAQFYHYVHKNELMNRRITNQII